MFLLCREKERLYHAKPFTRGTTAAIGSNRGGPYKVIQIFSSKLKSNALLYYLLEKVISLRNSRYL